MMGTTFVEPLAFRIYRRYLEGETIQEIAEDLRLALEPVRRRLAAAVVSRNGINVAPEGAQSPLEPALRG